MNTRQRAVFVFFLVIMTMLSAPSEGAGSGTLKFTFQYQNPATGTLTNLASGFVYLHNSTNNPPMEKFFSKADQILTGSYGNGSYNITGIPVGTYYIRILQRKTAGTASRPYGPPEAGDYTWFQTTPITISDGQTLDLGTLYATNFGGAITITGTVQTSTGTPLAGRYVRAQTVPCLAPLNCTASGCVQYGNECGQAKFMAQQPTDTAGNYTLTLRDPGTYYLYTSPCLVEGHNQNDNTRCPYTAAPGPVTVIGGDNKTVNIVTN